MKQTSFYQSSLSIFTKAMLMTIAEAAKFKLSSSPSIGGDKEMGEVIYSLMK